MVKEAKVKGFAVLFLALSWFHQGNHKKLSFNISKSTLINFHWNIFLDTFYLSVVSHSIIFIKIGTACLSFSRLNFVINVHISFGGWSCVIRMNRWCLWSGIGVKKNLMSIFYVALSTCSVVLPICHVVLSTWSVILPICPLILSTCYVILNGAYRSALPAKTQVPGLFAHSQRMPTHVGPLIQDWSVSVLFPWYKGNFFNLSKSMDRSFHTTLCFIRKCNCSTR